MHATTSPQFNILHFCDLISAEYSIRRLWRYKDKME